MYSHKSKTQYLSAEAAREGRVEGQLISCFVDEPNGPEGFGSSEGIGNTDESDSSDEVDRSEESDEDELDSSGETDGLDVTNNSFESYSSQDSHSEQPLVAPSRYASTSISFFKSK